ncbi:FUSC family protein [Streptomyces sp. N35]|uniref:FUSC family protein n=1 Tax=Streptomyces sp. N35 TaxID=2795730 RepID=UPI0018F5E6D7|nr:FUSC family protein [Streptomyces sp. N35]
MGWTSTLKDAARSGLRVERTRLEPLITLRATVGLALSGGLALWLFGGTAAAGAAYGALLGGIAVFQRSWRPDPLLPVISALTLGVTTFLSYLTGGCLPLFLALLALWAFLGGMAWSLGANAGSLGTTNAAVMLVTVALPVGVTQALGQAALMVGGGLVQAALVVLFPIRRWGRHRDALADALSAEADYARRLRDDPAAPFTPGLFAQARDAATLSARHARRRPAELHGARGLAEQIRPLLGTLADPSVTGPGLARVRVDALLAAAATLLDATADAIRHGRPAELPPQALAAIEIPSSGPALTGPAHQAAGRLRALLHDVVDTAGGRHGGCGDGHGGGGDGHGGGGDGHGGGGAGGDGSEGSVGAGRAGADRAGTLVLPSVADQFRGALATVRGQLRGDSPVFRHAVRLTAVMVVGDLIGRALPFGHGYWVPLVGALILRPGFSQTYSRAAARLGGTVLGLVIAGAIVELAHPGEALAAVLSVVCGGLILLFMYTGYAPVQAAASGYTVFTLGMAGVGLDQSVPARLVLTLIGGGLAMLAYALYPSWETHRLRTRLADWIHADLSYAATVVRHYAEPAEHSARETREAVLTARGALLAWRDAVALAAKEPVRDRGLSHTTEDGAERALYEAARVTMLLEAHVPAAGALPVPAAAPLAAALQQAADDAAQAVRDHRVPTWEPVRAALADWHGEGAASEMVHRTGTLLLTSLSDLSTALEYASPPVPLSR